MSIKVGRTIEAWLFSPETSKQIVEAFLQQGEGAYFRFSPREDPKTGGTKLDWQVPVLGREPLNGTPGGDDSYECPPICTPPSGP